MEDLQYRLTRMQIPKHEMLELAYQIRMANLQLNASAEYDEVAIEGYLQPLTRENKGHIYNLVEARLTAYGLTMQAIKRQPVGPKRIC